MEIRTKKDEIVLIDKEDFERLSFKSVYIATVGYAYTNKKELLHRLIMNAQNGEYVDHISGDKLDNRRSNLRICSNQENARNMKSVKTGSSAYKGVHWSVKNERWTFEIRVNNKRKYSYNFINEIAAANAYNYHAKELFGEFAKLNDCPFMEKEEWESFIYQRNKSSKYKGVYYLKSDNRWKAFVTNGKNKIVIGTFESEEDAYNTLCEHKKMEEKQNDNIRSI